MGFLPKANKIISVLNRPYLCKIERRRLMMILKISRVNVGYYATQLKNILRPPGLPVRLEPKPEDPVTRKEFFDFIDKLGHGIFKDLAEDLESIKSELTSLSRKR